MKPRYEVIKVIAGYIVWDNNGRQALSTTRVYLAHEAHALADWLNNREQS